MKLILLTSSLVVKLTGCNLFSNSNKANNPGAAPSAPETKTAASDGKSDSYEIRWEGRPGLKMTGSYLIAHPGSPMQRELVEMTLPKSIKLTVPSNSAVSATGDVPGRKKEDFTVRIFKNGSECGKVGAVSTTSKIPDNKVCMP